MAGTITITLVGVFRVETLKAGVDGQNVVADDAASQTATMIYVPTGQGDIAVFKEARA